MDNQTIAVLVILFSITLLFAASLYLSSQEIDDE